MKKNLFILLLCLILIFTCIFSALGNTAYKNSNGVSTQSTSPSLQSETQSATAKPQTYDTEIKDPVTLEVSQTSIISITDDEETSLESWTSSDSSVAAVDSGGRIDAQKVGKATVTAVFSNNKKYEYEITVVEQTKQEEADRFSTAITANSDILSKNLSDNSGKNPYSIYVNRKMNCVTVYTYDENGEYTVPVRAMVCSCGENYGTITGDFNIYFKNKWNALFDNVYGYYVSGISGDYLFHSVPYYTPSPDDLEVEEFNKLGEDASLGCVRMAMADTKWIYENCDYNTSIKIYDDDNPGPLGKPDTIKITDFSCGWDPTDDNKNNPYYNKNPQIIGAENCTIKKGSKYDPLDNIKALDTCSNDITDKVSVTGNVVTSREGKYKVTYSVTDALNRTKSVDITVTVKE